MTPPILDPVADPVPAPVPDRVTHPDLPVPHHPEITRSIRRRDRALRIACICALVGLAFMVWSVLQPSWIPVMLGLTLGQAIGTLSFAVYLVLLITDLGIRRRLKEHEDRHRRARSESRS